MPEVSVIVPVYNVEAYLEKCVNSIMKQSAADFELILVDDGSTDKSGGICDSLKENDSRIRVIHQENSGLGAARNMGIENAAGEWLLFADSDDYIQENTLEKSLEAGKALNADIVVFGFQSVNEAGEVLSKFVDDVPKGQSFSAEMCPDMLLGAPVAWNRLYRRSVFADTGIRYPGRAWFEDIRTTPKLLTRAKRVVYIEDVLYNYLMRDGSITKNSKADRNIEIIEAFDDTIGYFKDKGLYDTFKNELEYLAVFHLYIAASVRVLRIDPKHPLLLEFRIYMEKEFPNYRDNPYLDKRLDKNKKIVLRLLEKKMYKTAQLIFRMKA